MTSSWYSARFSSETIAELIERVAAAYTHSELTTLMIRLDIDPDDEWDEGPRGNKRERSTRLVTALQSRDSDDGAEILSLLRELVEEHWDGDVYSPVTGEPMPYARRLLAGLRKDGLEVIDGHLVASTPDPAPLAPEMSLVERELDDRGLEVAAKHYRQAIDSYTDSRLEASNGQLRSALESLLVSIGSQVLDKPPKDPKGAVERLRQQGMLDGDEALMIKGLVGLSNSRGAHHGLTDEEEATFRLHASTAVMRYILARTAD